MRRVGAGVVVCLCCWWGAGCQRDIASTAASQPAATQRGEHALRDWVRDPAVEPVDANRPCPRLLSAGPNVTEICCALGLGDCLIGRTRYCTYPPRIVDVPSIGALNDLNVEVLLGLEPEVVLVSGQSRGITERLARLGIGYETLPDESLVDLMAGIRRIGALANRDATAAQLLEAVESQLASVAARYDDLPSARVLVTLAPLADPPMQVFAAGPGSFYDDLLQRVRQRNILAESQKPFAPASLEFILTADPDVIIELSPDGAARAAGDVAAREAWAQVGPLKAVAAGRVHVLAGQQHFILGPRVAETLEALCALIAGGRHE